MSTQNTVWVVISSQEVADKIRSGIDGGEFSRVNDLTTYLDGFNARIKSLVQQYGGHIFAMLYDRTILEIPMTIAEMVPDMISELKEKCGAVACGIGMSYTEAAHACRDSQASDEIEMFGEDDSAVQKADPDQWEGDFDPFQISPNLFNPDMQRTVENIPEKAKKPKAAPVLRPEVDQELQIESQYLQAVGQSIAPPPPQPAPGQQPGGQGQPGEEEEEPQDLLESLNGGKVPGHKPDTGEDEEGGSEKEGGKKSEDSEKEGDDEEVGDDAQEKLANSLIGIRDRIPELMALADKNPEAFKQSMALIQKLVALAKEGKAKGKATKKSEMDALNEKMDDLVKNLILPVGSRRGRRKKVLIDGKQVWRSMGSGQVQDARGEPVSVKSHNAVAATGSKES